MRCSANEIMTLAAKAARGAGAPPSQAAAFGAAVVCHLRAERPLENVTAALAILPKGPILAFPVIVIRMVELSAQNFATGDIKAGRFTDLALSYFDAQPYVINTSLQGDSIQCQMLMDEPNLPPPTPRITVPDDLVATLQNLAAKLLVPESDASRLSGAGAGLTDND